MSTRLISSVLFQHKTKQAPQVISQVPRRTSQSARIVCEHYDPLNTDGVVDKSVGFLDFVVQ